MSMDEETLKKLQSATPEEALAAIGLNPLDVMASITEDPYELARREFEGVPTRRPSGTEGAVSAIRGLASFTTAESWQTENTGAEKDYLESATGKIMYPNGAIFDPATGKTLYPSSTRRAQSIQGSVPWLIRISEEWSDAKVAEWRKKLAGQGYDVAEKGEMADDLLFALQEYHENRYAKLGRVLPKTPGGEAAGEVTIQETFDKQALRAEIKTWGQVPFGEDLNNDEADWLSDRVIKVAQRLFKKHKGAWTTEQVHAGAQARVFEEFADEPQVAALVKEQEDQEVSYKIRDSIVGLSDLLGA